MYAVTIVLSHKKLASDGKVVCEHGIGNRGVCYSVISDSERWILGRSDKESVKRFDNPFVYLFADERGWIDSNV